MSGHSKWNNIKRKKEKTDAAKAKIFTKVGREIAVIVKMGGPNPAENSKLKDAIAKAKAANVPNENIERIIKKAAGDGEANNYEELLYEGYGPNGVAVIVETATDSRNRTGANVRHFFDKFGGNLGTTGCVSFMFTDKGVIIIEADGIDEEKLMEDALMAGAEDISADDGIFEITTAPEDLDAVTSALTEAGYTIASSDNDKIPANYVTLSEEESITKMVKLLDALEEDEDVQDDTTTGRTINGI